MSSGFFVHESAYLDEGAEVGEGTHIWHFSHVMPGAVIGKGCSLGQNVNVAPQVVIGDNVKIQNNVSVYEGVTLEDSVFCGPSMVFTNVANPRSEIPRMGELKRTLVRKGATLGANSTIIDTDFHPISASVRRVTPRQGRSAASSSRRSSPRPAG